jgi:hypothetical protein
VFEIASMEMGRTEWALLVRFRRRTHASTALLPVALGPNLVTEAVECGLCGEGVSEETLEPLPEVLRMGTDTAALKDATAVARA